MLGFQPIMNFKPELRQEFLENHWERYPVATTQNYGRITALAAETLTLETLNEKTTYKISKEVSLAPGFSIHDCLATGDIVEVDPEGKTVKLLVPSFGDRPFLNKNFGVDRSQTWNKYVAHIRDFFLKKKFIELRTPTLVPSPGLEPFLDPFKTKLNLGRVTQDLYLPTSPEFHLKKALTLGFERVFEFKECFRNGELSDTHQPEFLMLEWYRAYEKTESIIEDVTRLFEEIQKTFRPESPLEKVMVFKMEDLWKDVLNFTLKSNSTIQDLAPLARDLKIGGDEKDFDDLFNLIFLEKIEPALKKLKAPVIIWHYPPSQAALARLTPDGWADRFEVYWRGFEIANAFHELNNFEEQKLRFKNDQEKKKALGKEIVPIDEEFVSALKWGMPPSAGIALGVERLFMGLFDLKDLSQCRLFSLKN
jgi:elongation factor P--(R)-beta-lysine ligase